MPPRRQNLALLIIIAVSGFIGFSLVLSFAGHSQDTPFKDANLQTTDSILHGEATAPKLENATLKAELGNAAWKVLHTTMAKFPDKPTPDDSASLKSFVYLFARLYPCGECARHFQKILTKFPPQVGSRSSAAAWACHAHNEVNKSLKKEIFDCTKIGDFYDCGCADDESSKSAQAQTRREHFTPLALEKEGLTRGG